MILYQNDVVFVVFNFLYVKGYKIQNQLPVEAAGGRFFRPQKALHNRLEFYHDTVGVLLNHQLESKSEEFWRTVHSYSALHGELESAIEKAHAIRFVASGILENIFDLRHF